MSDKQLEMFETQMVKVERLAKLPDDPLLQFTAEIPVPAADELVSRWAECCAAFYARYKHQPIHGFVWVPDRSRRVFFRAPSLVE